MEAQLQLTSRQQALYRGLRETLDAMAPGERVPSVRQLMGQYRVSQVSVEKVLQLIRTEVPLVSRQGEGTYKDGEVATPGTILLLVPDFDSQFIARIRFHFNQAITQGGFRLVTEYFPWQQFPTSLSLGPEVAAVFVYPPAQLDAEQYSSLQSCPVPVVMLDVIPYGTTLDAVGTDNEHGGALAANHLLRNGHSRLAMLFAEPEGHPNALARLRGFSRQLQLAGLAEPQIIRCHTANGVHASASAYEAMATLLESGKPDFSGLFVDSVSGAMGVLTACHRRGLTLPDDLAVICFDDPPESAFVQPSLSAIRQDFPAWARKALQIVERRRAGDHSGPLQIATPPQLVVRESTGGDFHYHQPQLYAQVSP